MTAVPPEVPTAPADPAEQARRAQKLARVAQAHDEWVARWADEAPYDPQGVTTYGDDYPLFYMDLDPTPEMAEDLNRRIAEALAEPTAPGG